MQFRFHKGLLAKSIETVTTIEPSREAILELAQKQLSKYGLKVVLEDISIAPYGFDDRIKWDTFIVSIHGYGVMGFTDGPIIENKYKLAPVGSITCDMEAMSRDGLCGHPAKYIWSHQQGQNAVCERCAMCVMVNGGHLIEIDKLSKQENP